jgi:hypothetical protein
MTLTTHPHLMLRSRSDDHFYNDFEFFVFNKKKSDIKLQMTTRFKNNVEMPDLKMQTNA